MSLTASDRFKPLFLMAVVLLALGGPTAAAAQQRVLSSEVEISREAASLRLGLESGRSVALAIRSGRVVVDGRDIGAAPRGGELDRAWRALLNEAIEVPSGEVGALLAGWAPPSTTAGSALLAEFEALFAAAPAADVAAVPPGIGADALSDSVTRMRERIRQLEGTVAELERATPAPRAAPAPPTRASRSTPWWNPLRHVWRGVAGVLSVVVTYAVLFAIAFVAIFFGARRYIEGVAETARRATLRSGLVGIAGTFLVVPAFILGIVALAISVVGIPALLIWIPFFPVAVVVAALLGYYAVAHAAGESLAERRFSSETWFERGNSYYFILSGLVLLMSFFVAGHVVQMAGPWLGFIRGLLMFIGVVVTWAAVTVGFGAVLISRAGTRPLAPAAAPDLERDLFTEDAHA
jgi:hypothetical protein